MELRKRNILLIILLILLVLAAVSFVIAFRTHTGRVNDHIVYGSVELEVIENTLSGGVEVPFAQETPVYISEDEYSRIVRVKNTGKHPAYVRASLSMTATDSDGQEIALPADLFSFDINTDDWKESEGWYYYESAALAENEETNTLMTKIRFNRRKLRLVAGGQLTLHIRAEAVQSENNGNNVWQAAGWPAEQGGVTP